MLKARCTDIEKCTTDGGREMKFIERGTKRVKQPWHHFVEDSVNLLKNNVYFPIVEVLYKSFLVYKSYWFPQLCRFCFVYLKQRLKIDS